ncbi:MAG TPA: acyl carrier protein [Bacteroidales bacterium]|jgi:acyl carrier protein|nr:acyl carrier protein [Bacteroidales bacterium]
MKEKFLEQIKEVFELEDTEVHLEDNFRDYERWDSLTNLTLIAMLDSEFGVVIESKDFNKLNTVGELLNEVEKRMK